MLDVPVLAPRQIAALLDASQKALVAEIAALGAHAGRRLVPGEWSANEVLGHLVEAERRGFAGRIRAIVTKDRPVLETWDAAAIAAARRDEERDPEDLIGEFIDVRDESLALVRALGPGALARVGLHPAVGELTVRELVHEWVHHDRDHLAQVLDLTRRLVWPGMGNARRFSEPGG